MSFLAFNDYFPRIQVLDATPNAKCPQCGLWWESHSITHQGFCMGLIASREAAEKNPIQPPDGDSSVPKI